jgi:hypothetical protein
MVTTRGCPCDGEARAHVAACHLDNWRCGLQASVCFGGEQDGASRSILHASSRLQKLGFGEQAARAGMGALERDQRRAADEIES